MNEQIISVPHSATRSLKKHLGFDGFWHWGANDPDIDLFTGLAHIPLRDPFDVSMSWHLRYGDDETHSPDNMLWRFDKMINYAGPCKHWRVDKLPEREGIGLGMGRHWEDEPDRDKAAALDRSIALRAWFNESQMAQALYAEFFPEGFWWV